MPSVLSHTTVSTPDATEAFAITKPAVALSVSFFTEVMLIIYLAMMLMRLFGGCTVCCARGKLDVETDGGHRHANPEKAKLDNLRYNDFESASWQ